ncbi:aldo/keto reductase [Streptomyces caelestis]|uniref:aldo/keto reductase n=1 Tax=Streptomyces caelestis TaxID=36816 RepID=UPI00364EF3F6
MRTRKPERTGIEASACRPGATVFGKPGDPDHEDCVRTIHRALGAGVGFAGTAEVYGHSETEEAVGKALRGRRDEVVPATEFNGPTGEGPHRSGGSRRRIIQAVEGSPKRLRTDCIDLHQIHHPDPLDVSHSPPSLTRTNLRRRPAPRPSRSLSTP